MKCLIFSDSHGSVNNMREAIGMHRDAEAIFFLGDGLREADLFASEYSDKAFIAVRGNCDFYPYFRGAEADKNAALTLEGKRIVATHGDLYGVKYALGQLRKLARDTGADIVLFGHTHSPLCECVSGEEKSVYLFNPGSIALGSFGVLMLKSDPEFLHCKISGY